MKRPLISIVLSICLLFLVASLATAQGVLIYDNGVSATVNTGVSSQLDTLYPFESKVADDFILPLNGENPELPWGISGVTFTGLQFNDPPDLPNPAIYQIDFYADDGTGTGPFYSGDGTTTPKVDALCSFAQELLAPEPAPGPYSYSAIFDPFDCKLNKEELYWISIAAQTEFPPQWGWQGDNASGGNAVTGFPLLGTPFWTPLAPGTEMDFQIFAVKTPEPATGLMLLLGLAGLGFCRRR